ncbi:MAG: hypothetical protein JWQ27_540 [Ferruginibacter sp.]|nr:hypothetical protein [Ferruginibacter sp.]
MRKPLYQRLLYLGMMLVRLTALTVKKLFMLRVLKYPLIIFALLLPVAVFNKSLNSFLFGKKANDESTSSKQKTAGLNIVQKWELPEILLEVSGIAWLDNNRFATVQDELGTIFIYNTGSGRIEKEIPFTGAGDFEGIDLVGETAWIMRSDGLLFEVSSINQPKPVVTQYQTHLTARQNVEGLAYDRKNNRLLAAIKGPEAAQENYKGIYAFDLATKTMAKEPVYRINFESEVFSGEKKKKTNKLIQPSEIAVHPISGEIYITDAIGPKLIVMDASGEIKSLYHMSLKDFNQAEGMSFSPDGKLFISNEGKKMPANILEVSLDKE